MRNEFNLQALPCTVHTGLHASIPIGLIFISVGVPLQWLLSATRGVGKEVRQAGEAKKRWWRNGKKEVKFNNMQREGKI